MRGFAAAPIALFLMAAPAFADTQQHINAAKKAERSRDWSKALEEWKAAYSADPNAEYLIAIGDAYSKLGNKSEAKKNYEAYLADPLALPSNVEKVKGKIAELNSALALSGGGLSPPGADPLALRADSGKKKKSDKKTADALGLDLPFAAPAEAKKAPDPMGLPGLDLPAAPAPKEKKIAAASPLDLPYTPPPPAKKEPEKVVSNSLDLPLPGAPRETKPPPAPPKQLAVTTPPPKPERKPVPDAVIVEVPATRGTSSGVTRTVAFVAAGVAVVALGGGALALTKASSAHSDLTSKVHDGATAQQLLETEQRNKTVSFLSFAGGLVAAGIATALFAF
jgi:hypothetical protein